MSFEAYKKRLFHATPQLKDASQKMTITVESFLKQLEKAYAQGRSDSKSKTDAADDFSKFGRKDFLNDLFK